MPTRRTTRTIGGLCAHGHRLTHDNVYRRPDGGIRCATCTAENHLRSRRRRGIKPRYAREPELPEKPCRGCGKVLPLARFGSRGLRADGTPKWHSWCGRCRVAASNERKAAAVREWREREEEERTAMTAWLIAKVDQITGPGHRGVLALLRELGVSVAAWYAWRVGRQRPQMERIKRVTDRLVPILVREGIV